MKFIDFVKEKKPDFEFNWHHDIICNQMEKWANSKDGKLIILTPPRSSKSTLASIMLPAYMRLYSSDRINVFEYSSANAYYFNSRFFDIVVDEIHRTNTGPVSGPVYFDRIGATTPRRVDAGIIDDPNIIGYDDSKKLAEWYDNSYRTQFKNNEKTLLICSAVPGCLAKHIIDKHPDKWDIVRIKAFQNPIVTTSDKLDVWYWESTPCPNISILNDNIVKSLYQQELI